MKLLLYAPIVAVGFNVGLGCTRTFYCSEHPDFHLFFSCRLEAIVKLQDIPFLVIVKYNMSRNRSMENCSTVREL